MYATVDRKEVSETRSGHHAALRCRHNNIFRNCPIQTSTDPFPLLTYKAPKHNGWDSQNDDLKSCLRV